MGAEEIYDSVYRNGGGTLFDMTKFTSRWSNYADRIFSLVAVNDIVTMSHFDNKGRCFYSTAINIYNVWTFILSVIIDPCGPVVTEKCDVSQGIINNLKQLYAKVILMSNALKVANIALEVQI